ncbi:sigma-70 family RNA polymerase sigma factor [Cryobacterium lactosi]|uniref:RNA polymerase sigma factor n=1 Tax=Cryobacterium lactosi TaxID=1259202 RepID=A0A4R9BGP1_9MICO|nr:sigma-70 family RNA polymerase sigma factor [Cryobacterium lactosi]TFD84060.1 sigma-70 family RNA polymerase sigma factor [Cryobacterium lactosi]
MTAIAAVRDPMNSLDRRPARPHSATRALAGEDVVSFHDVGTLQFKSNTDVVLVNYAVAGNETAFAILVRRHRPLMRCCALRILGSSAEADDVVQESCITAWQKLSTLNDGNCLKSWLMRVVRNKSMDRLRMRPSSTFPLDDNTPETLRIGPFQFVESILQRDALSKVLASLPANQRRAWLMRGCSGFSYAVIAGKLGVPVSTVRGLLARSRHTVAHEMAYWR